MVDSERQCLNLINVGVNNHVQRFEQKYSKFFFSLGVGMGLAKVGLSVCLLCSF